MDEGKESEKREREKNMVVKYFCVRENERKEIYL